MVQRSADGGARVAVVGASTPDGSHLREALAALRVPGSRVDLYATSTEEVLLSEYAGEARLIQQPDETEIAAHDVVFLCERGALTAHVASRLRPGSVAIDLVGALTEPPPRPVIHMDVNPEAVRGHGGLLAVPHPVAILVSELVFPLDRAFGVEEVVALVIRPAADFGERGVEELREQTVRLLNFAELPVDTFGRQLAFNIIPEARLPGEFHDLETRIPLDVTAVLGWSACRMTLRMLTAPLFHGHGVLLRVRLSRTASAARVREALESPEEADGAGAPATPLDVLAGPADCRADVSEDGLGGYWLWAVAGELGARGAEQAIRLARSLSDL